MPKAPEGYTPDPTVYTLSIDGDGNITVTPNLAIEAATGSYIFENHKEEESEPGFRLPDTGGPGIIPILFAGISSVGPTIVSIKTKKRGDD